MPMSEVPSTTGALELGYAEHLLLQAVRAMAIGRGDCPMIQRSFADACGPLANQAMTALFVLVKQLAWKSGRRLALHVPGCRRISGDELMLLRAFADAQAVAHTQTDARLDEQLGRLLGRAPDPSIRASIRMVAYLLSLNGHSLTCQETSVGARSAQSPPAGATLH